MMSLGKKRCCLYIPSKGQGTVQYSTYDIHILGYLKGLWSKDDMKTMIFFILLQHIGKKEALVCRELIKRTKYNMWQEI